MGQWTHGNDPASPITKGLIELENLGHLNGAGATNPFGLTKREQFAAMAMQGMLANSIDKKQSAEPFWFMSQENLAKVAVWYADALIAELNKEKEP